MTEVVINKELLLTINIDIVILVSINNISILSNVMKINRKIKDEIIQNIHKGMVIRIYGLRRSGKTTLCKDILKELNISDTAYYNCEILSNKEIFETTNPDKIKDYINGQNLIILDEAQNVSNIGLTLKIMVDTYPEIQIIATGSSSFELANQTGEPLVGRNYTYNLFPISIGELKQNGINLYYNKDFENWLRFGMMPDIFSGTNDKEKKDFLDNITTSYLFKDILEYENVKSSSVLVKLLKALAFQVGNQVSYNELGQVAGLSAQTVEKYIDLLEKSFIVYRIYSFSRNLRNELKSSCKVFFWDLGIRNSLIQNFNTLDNRDDIGALWENFCITEIIKNQNTYQPWMRNNYFWRTSGTNSQEIDFIVDRDGILNCFEFKYSEKKSGKIPTQFSSTYKNHTYKIINKSNFPDITDLGFRL